MSDNTSKGELKIEKTFYPSADRLLRSRYTLPWGLQVEYDKKRDGFWVVHDPEYKNTVSDPRGDR